jgi:tape measure domain-containing protein
MMNPGLVALHQSLLRGRIDIEEARVMMECTPRLVEAILAGMRIDRRKFLSMARAGELTMDMIGKDL